MYKKIDGYRLIMKLKVRLKRNFQSVDLFLFISTYIKHARLC